MGWKKAESDLADLERFWGGEWQERRQAEARSAWCRCATGSAIRPWCLLFHIQVMSLYLNASLLPRVPGNLCYLLCFSFPDALHTWKCSLVPRSVCSSIYLPSLLPQLPPPVALETWHSHLGQRLISFQSLEWWGRILLLLGYLSCQHRLLTRLLCSNCKTT